MAPFDDDDIVVDYEILDTGLIRKVKGNQGRLIYFQNLRVWQDQPKTEAELKREAAARHFYLHPRLF